ncbi:MAG: SpoIIE family protein phosphatase [bacterium]|nr:MAG: SpoIIE family protein phosphatase [bacterium]
MDEKEQILRVLARAIIKETNAFNYYYKGSEDPAMPPGVKGVLSRLAEEERKHRQTLMYEYRGVERGWRDKQPDESEHALSYVIPEELPFFTTESSQDLEISAVSLPSRLVGGDNILSRIVTGHNGTETGTILLLYDAMGHGIKTTDINALAARVLGEYFEQSAVGRVDSELLRPKDIVRLLNQRINERYEGEGVFLSVLCIFFDSRNKTLVYTCAGHEPPFLVHEGGRVGSLLYTQLLAGIDREYPYREYKVPFDDGDLLCIFTDGIVEVENGDGEIFGRERIADILEGSWRDEPEQVIRDLLDGMQRYNVAEEIKDEISIVVIRSKGA